MFSKSWLPIPIRLLTLHVSLFLPFKDVHIDLLSNVTSCARSHVHKRNLYLGRNTSSNRKAMFSCKTNFAVYRPAIGPIWLGGVIELGLFWLTCLIRTWKPFQWPWFQTRISVSMYLHNPFAFGRLQFINTWLSGSFFFSLFIAAIVETIRCTFHFCASQSWSHIYNLCVYVCTWRAKHRFNT